MQDSAVPVALYGPKVEMIAIPGGTLGMACAAEDDNRCDKDYHEVDLHPFQSIVLKWKSFISMNVWPLVSAMLHTLSAPTTVVLEAAGMPAGGIQWHQAGDYCEWVGKLFTNQCGMGIGGTRPGRWARLSLGQRLGPTKVQWL